MSRTPRFEQLRTKLLAWGNTDERVTDFGVMHVLTFTDPDATRDSVEQDAQASEPQAAAGLPLGQQTKCRRRLLQPKSDGVLA
jgi:hypothetical protein